jgi:hypothetical protein
MPHRERGRRRRVSAPSVRSNEPAGFDQAMNSSRFDAYG